MRVKQIRTVLASRSQAATGLLIFVACVFVYLINGRTTLTSSDNIVHTLLAFNWLENHALNFDVFRDSYLYQGGGIPFYFVEAPNGHLSSRYPIGTAIVSFPLYVIFFIYLKLLALFQSLGSGVPSDLLDIASKDFDGYRRSFGKLAATLSSAFTVVLFYLSVRLKFNQAVALITTFTFAFATGTWAIASQDLRQHTISNLLLVSLMLCLMKAARTNGSSRRPLLWIAGIFCGLLPGVRLTSAVFAVAIAIYVVYVYRREAFFFLLGLPSVLLNLAWNFYFFGVDNFLIGGYIKHLEQQPVSYSFEPKQVLWSAAGILFSPSDGFFFFSPVLLFGLYGAYRVFKTRAGRDEQLLLCLTFACLALYLHCCFYLFWIGGTDSFGSRLMTDTLPVVCFLVGYFLIDLMQAFDRQRVARVVLALFIASLMVSTAVETVGAFTQTSWGSSPLQLGVNKNRIWNLEDNQINRHFRNLVAQVAKPIKDRKNYLRGFQGKIEQVKLNENDSWRPLGSPLTVRPKQRKILQASLNNTGTSQWYGYETGMESLGETKIKISFVNSQGETITMRAGDKLYISGTPQAGERAEAIGSVLFPDQPGKYQLKLTLFADGISNLKNALAPSYSSEVIVLDYSKK
ncbi:hypothetical protein IFO70_31355 [Phormidium tenue FACHB-886]|nr:hypothetical protein [Phormidium tenue FACHB-886]